MQSNLEKLTVETWKLWRLLDKIKDLHVDATANPLGMLQAQNDPDEDADCEFNDGLAALFSNFIRDLQQEACK